MLIKLQSDKFRQRSISFRAGLNVVLGDDNATNSIGKSSLLMVLDFAFGGNSLLEHNKDVIAELGHHDYCMIFQFHGEKYYFCRGTSRPELVYQCEPDFSIRTSIGIDDFRAFLKSSYLLGDINLSFRAFVGLYARIWGKKNLDVHRPLNNVPTQSPKECIDNLIKTYAAYDPIAQLTSELKEIEGEESDLKKAFRRQIAPKISDREYKKNVERIASMQMELTEIKENLALLAVNINAIANKEMLELKAQKDELLEVKLRLESKLLRIQRNLSDNKFIKSRYFESLREFFPQVDTTRLAEIEIFHSELAKILRGEIEESKRETAIELGNVNSELSLIDEKLLGKLGRRAPGAIVDRVLSVSSQLQIATQENHFHEKMESISRNVDDKQTELSEKKEGIVRKIEETLNRKMRDIVTSVFGEQRKSPHITLTENNYGYEVFEDTGTGMAYSSLIVFDLAVFETTKLPLVIHDSLLFKNIENSAVSNLIRLYLGSERQSFIAIDEVDKYGQSSASVLRSRSVIQLDDQNVLYIKDWRKH